MLVYVIHVGVICRSSRICVDVSRIRVDVHRYTCWSTSSHVTEHMCWCRSWAHVSMWIMTYRFCREYSLFYRAVLQKRPIILFCRCHAWHLMQAGWCFCASTHVLIINTCAHMTRSYLTWLIQLWHDSIMCKNITLWAHVLTMSWLWAHVLCWLWAHVLHVLTMSTCVDYEHMCWCRSWAHVYVNTCVCQHMCYVTWCRSWAHVLM